MLKIRQPHDRFIFNMAIPIPEKAVFILRQGPGSVRAVWPSKRASTKMCGDPNE